MLPKAGVSSLVLVAARHAEARDRYGSIFADAGYRVCAAQRDEAQTLARSAHPQAIVLESPRRARDDDKALLARIQQDSKTRGIPVVVVTSSADPRRLAGAIAAGVAAVVPAREDPAALLRVTGVVIEQSHASTWRDDWRLVLNAILKTAPERYADGAMRRRAEALMATLDESRIAMLVANNDARYVDANNAACDVTGYSRVELLTKSVWDLTPEPARDGGRTQWRRFLAVGGFDGSYAIARKDGSLIACHAVAAANVLPGLHVSGLALAIRVGRLSKRGAA